jgi:hypothetical protein
VVERLDACATLVHCLQPIDAQTNNEKVIMRLSLQQIIVWLLVGTIALYILGSHVIEWLGGTTG